MYLQPVYIEWTQALVVSWFMCNGYHKQMTVGIWYVTLMGHDEGVYLFMLAMFLMMHVKIGVYIYEYGVRKYVAEP